MALHVLSGRPAADSKSRSERPRVGLCRTPRWALADDATRSNLEAAARRLAQAGAQVRDFELPPGSEQLFDRHKVIMGYETARSLAWEYANHRGEISKTLLPRLEDGWQVTRAEYDAMREHSRQCRRALSDSMRDSMRGVDFLLTPSAASEAPASLASTGDPVFNRAWTLFGVPCVTLPHGKGPHGLPLGVQLVGPFDGDSALLAWAQWTAEVLD